MNEWVRYPRIRPDATVRLFCFPAAGGGTGSFRPWIVAGHPYVELALVRLPGRETRIHEPPVRDLSVLADRLVEAAAPELTTQYALFGHSTGALVAFELARLLSMRGYRPPAGVFVAAEWAPHAPKPPGVSTLPAAELLDLLERLGGTPATVLADPVVRKLALPAIRADFAMQESYAPMPGAVVPCSIRAFAGSRDDMVPPVALAEWERCTTGRFELTVFGSNHFFVNTMARQIMDAVVRDCVGATPAKARP